MESKKVQFVLLNTLNQRVCFLSFIIFCFFLTSCEKKIEFDLNETEPKLVVEASIENGQPPYVQLMRSVGYFSKITTDMLQKSFVHNASVFISNGTLTHKLKEYQVNTGTGLVLYYYTIDSSQLSTAFVGTLKSNYSLKIISEGKEYTASTFIPDLNKKIDSLWWKPSPGNPDTTEVIVMAKVTDPPGYGNYIRYFTKMSGSPLFLPPVNSVFDDLFIDGSTYEVQVQPGINRNLDDQETDFFHRGDTIQFKISNIDKQTYDFWRTWESSYSNIGNPFSTPSKVLGNISNDALGYFAGYASEFRSLIIPK